MQDGKHDASGSGYVGDHERCPLLSIEASKDAPCSNCQQITQLAMLRAIVPHKPHFVRAIDPTVHGKWPKKLLLDPLAIDHGSQRRGRPSIRTDCLPLHRAIDRQKAQRVCMIPNYTKLHIIRCNVYENPTPGNKETNSRCYGTTFGRRATMQW